MVYDDENDFFLDSKENTDRIFICGLINNLEEAQHDAG